ncbi:hypothetical protein DO021_06545 [Desulfobacter hydrogenophilus]|uniref:Uncharacterized protein n=1 Tax=Desulfobacter hydrogenophilus TaxID=2291 RepID=A0A328FDZ7_9BACT|nr:hypothetical protein DO021_06545 [Desulfobacter hydrogenophilus]
MISGHRGWSGFHPMSKIITGKISVIFCFLFMPESIGNEWEILLYVVDFFIVGFIFFLRESINFQ